MEDLVSSRGGAPEPDENSLRAEAVLLAREELIARLERRLTARDRQIGRMEEQAAAQEERLRALQRRLDQEIDSRDEVIRSLWGEIDGKNGYIRQVEAEIGRREQGVQWLQGQLAGREEELRRLEAHRVETARTLDTVLGSWSWHLTRPIWGAGKRFRRLLRARLRVTGLLHALRRRLRFLSPGARKQGRAVRDTGLFEAGFYLRHSPDLNSRFTDPALHYVLAGAREGRDPHPLFDTSYYLDRYPDAAASGTNPLLHYCAVGAAQGYDPHPLFDTSFYLERYPDLAASGLNPLAHYLTHGVAEGRDPHPLFDTSFYLERYPDVAASGANPLLHYLIRGAAEGRDPHPLFDMSFYLERGPDAAAAGSNPVLHYLTHGVAEGRDPHPLFDTSFYLERYPDLAASGLNPLAHYLTHGVAEGRDPHPLFDTSFYLERYPDVAASGANPLLHYLIRGAAEGRDPHPLFDVSFYLERGPDAAAAGSNPVLHYLTHGVAEGRDPHPLFDTSFYLERYPDLAASGLNPLAHYLTAGAAEGRDPHPLFSSAHYTQANPDCAASGLNPLLHYLAVGRTPQPRKVHPDFDADFYLAWAGDVPPDETPLGNYVARFGSPPGPAADEALIRWVDRLNRAGSGNAVADDAPPGVSIILPTSDALPQTLGCIESLLAHRTRHRYEIVVVDSGSEPRTSRVLQAVQGVRHVRTQSGAGLARSWNDGVRHARGEHVLLLRGDVRVLDSWLDELIDTFAHTPLAGLIGSRLLAPTGRLREAGVILWSDGTASGHGAGEDRRQPEYSCLQEADSLSGASRALPRKVWDQVGGLDESYSSGDGADCDLAVRVREAGYRVLCQPLSEVVHLGGVGDRAGRSGQERTALELRQRGLRCLAQYGRPGEDLETARDRWAVGRVLVVDHVTPTPDQDAGSAVAVGVLGALQGLGYRVTFIPDNLAYASRYTEDLQRVGVECRHLPHETSIEDHLRRLGRRYEAVVLLRGPIAAKHLSAVAHYAPQAKVIFHTTDLHYLRERRQAEVEENPDLARHAEETRRLELGCMLRADCTVVVSQFEKDVLAGELPWANVYFFPYVIEARGCAAPFERRQDLLYLGGFNHTPNVDAVLYFLDEIWPRIKARHPGMRFYVVGSHPPRAIRDAARADVIVTGFVPDLAEYLDRVRLTVVPLRYGAGIKGKVVMSMSHGVPCVVTPMASEGMLLTDGREALIADGPERFTAAVLRAYDDPTLWHALSRGGLEFVEANYSPRRGRDHVRQILASIGVEPKGKQAAGWLKRAG